MKQFLNITTFSDEIDPILNVKLCVLQFGVYKMRTSNAK